MDDPKPFWPRFEKALFRRTHPLLLMTAAGAVLAGLYGAQRYVEWAIGEEGPALAVLSRSSEQIAQAKEHYAALKELKAQDVAQFKAGFSGFARSRKTLFESGLSIQEERRLLEKQLEIMTTYLVINPPLQRVFLMRGEQPLQSYLIAYIPLRSFPSASGLTDATTGQQGTNDTIRLPGMVRIVSKERFAHPERGKSEEVNGRLQYIPPQVGTSMRSNALGEFVMFTNSPLIIHGPPVNSEDHEKFPHVCLGLDREAARKLYRASFIGTKVRLQDARVTTNQENP